eukprot:TRINITY_DN28431_c0_g1_i1.p1 TRINITY_DN28431_c0_g1~~TRINITY_DN28431_c0_g1_i1.p1  ORF type:complete len:227 (+),score=38.52 TRINITY_DN28431_c0_g1_i1:55-735(+)
MASSGHQIWGAAEVLSCYDSSAGSLNSEPRRQRSGKNELPDDVKTHMENNVVQQASSESFSFSDSTSKRDGSTSKRDGFVAVLGESSPAELPSVGSATHEMGTCKPCLYAHSDVGCKKGASCRYCHIRHAKKSRARPCKMTRQKCKEIAREVDAFNPDFAQLREVMDEVGNVNPYMYSILRGKQRKQAEEGEEGEESGAPAEASLPTANQVPYVQSPSAASNLLRL